MKVNACVHSFGTNMSRAQLSTLIFLAQIFQLTSNSFQEHYNGIENVSQTVGA